MMTASLLDEGAGDLNDRGSLPEGNGRQVHRPESYGADQDELLGYR